MLKKQNFRSKKIMAMLPPEESESSDDGGELNCELNEGNLSPASSIYDLSPRLLEYMDIFDDDDIVGSPSILEKSKPDNMHAPTASNILPNRNVHTNPLPPFALPHSVTAQPATPQPATPQPATPQPASNQHSSPQPATPATPSSIITRRTKSLAKSASLATNTPNILRKRKQEHMNFNFKKSKFESHVDISDASLNFTVDFQSNKTPYNYFKMFIKDDLLELITEMTNLYSVQKKGRSINVSSKDIEKYLGIEIYMGIVDMPSYIDYWATETRYEQIANCMPLKTYEMIKNNIHFCDNQHIDPRDGFYKVRSVMEHVRQNCLTVEEENSYAIDEMMVPYKGKKAGSKRQYMPKKPTKWGFKFQVRAGNSGIVYDFFAYDGANTFNDEEFTEWKHTYLGIGGKTVVKLCKSIRNKPLSIIYFDNWFTSFELIYYLRNEFGILSLGTIRKDRMRSCKMTDDKTLKKNGRGSYAIMTDTKHKLTAVKWVDNDCVNLVSSYCGEEPVQTIQRYDKKIKQKVNVTCPHIIKEYNKNMGAVDKADMLVALYRVGTKSHKWYMNIFFHMMDISLNNSWLLYRRHCDAVGDKSMALKPFRLYVANVLMQLNSSSRSKSNTGMNLPIIVNPVIARPPPEARLDRVGHLPDVITQGRCRYCKDGKTTMWCMKCSVRLCLTKDKKCFHNFHTK